MYEIFASNNIFSDTATPRTNRNFMARWLHIKAYVKWLGKKDLEELIDSRVRAINIKSKA